MTLNLLQNVNPADVIAYARQVPEEEDFFLTGTVLPTVQRNSVKWRIKESTRFRSVAKFRAFDTETPRGRREVATKVTEGILPPLGQKLGLGEFELILHDLNRGADDSEMVDALYDDIENHVRAIRARLELAAGDLLTDGKFSLVDENGLTLEADFQVPTAFLPTAATLWTDTANSTPLDDEQAWTRLLVQSGEGRPVGGFASDAVLSLFAANLQYQRTYFGNVQSSYPTLTPDQVDAVREAILAAVPKVHGEPGCELPHEMRGRGRHEDEIGPTRKLDVPHRGFAALVPQVIARHDRIGVVECASIQPNDAFTLVQTFGQRVRLVRITG